MRALEGQVFVKLAEQYTYISRERRALRIQRQSREITLNKTRMALAEINSCFLSHIICLLLANIHKRFSGNAYFTPPYSSPVSLGFKTKVQLNKWLKLP